MPAERKPPKKTGNAADDFLAKRNFDASNKPSKLRNHDANAELNAIDQMTDVMSKEVFDADDYLKARNARAAAKLNPLGSA